METTILREPITYLIPTKRLPLPKGIECKFCGSENLVRYGKSKDLQLYLCRKCGRKGTDNRALPGKKIPPDIVSAVLFLRSKGLSYRDIKHQLQQKYGIKLSISTIYGWIVKGKEV